MLLSWFDIHDRAGSFAWYWIEEIYPNSTLQNDSLVEPQIAQPLLVESIHRHIIHDIGSSRMALDWGTMKLRLQPGLGFLRAVWLLIAQAASETAQPTHVQHAENPTLGI